jgi:hypothetical protein
MGPRFRSSWWPNACISIGPPARRSRCRRTSFTPSGSRSTTILIFAGSLIFCAELDRVGPAQADCVVTSFVAPSASNSPSSKPHIRPAFLLRTSHRPAGINDTWKICKSADGPFAGPMVRLRLAPAESPIELLKLLHQLSAVGSLVSSANPPFYGDDQASS